MLEIKKPKKPKKPEPEKPKKPEPIKRKPPEPHEPKTIKREPSGFKLKIKKGQPGAHPDQPKTKKTRSHREVQPYQSYPDIAVSNPAVKQATTKLDKYSTIIGMNPEVLGKKSAQGGLGREKIDKALQQNAPDKVWSNIGKDFAAKGLDRNLATQLDKDVFTRDLGRDLQKWGDMVASGRPDRNTLLKMDQAIADTIEEYDQKLEKLAGLKATSTPDGANLTIMREVLRAIAANISYTTKYLESKRVWTK
jgi:hypothetical protein